MAFGPRSNDQRSRSHRKPLISFLLLFLTRPRLTFIWNGDRQPRLQTKPRNFDFPEKNGTATNKLVLTLSSKMESKWMVGSHPEIFFGPKPCACFHVCPQMARQEFLPINIDMLEHHFSRSGSNQIPTTQCSRIWWWRSEQVWNDCCLGRATALPWAS